MKNFEFNYAKNFNCIGSECKHNCCVGWEIKIDKRSLKNYHLLANNDQRFSKENFDNGNFKLNKIGRCPFLEQDNLCYIIKHYGEKSLCKTCKTHPRFKNFFSGVTETGLGLYCEESCRIALSQKKISLVQIKGDNKPFLFSPFEKKILAYRNKALKIIRSRHTLEEKIAKLSSLCQIDLNKKSFNDWLEVFCKLEALSVNDFTFEKIPKSQDFAKINTAFEKQYINLLTYLVYRHISRAMDLLDLRVRLAFVILSFKMINHILSLNSLANFGNLVECVRFYTSEIECSDDNLFYLLNQIEDLICFI